MLKPRDQLDKLLQNPATTLNELNVVAASCGLQVKFTVQSKNTYRPRGHDLKGRCFTRLTVIRRYYGGDARQGRWWVCTCSCGSRKQVTVTSSQLMQGKTKSCGCLKTESANAARIKRWENKE